MPSSSVFSLFLSSLCIVLALSHASSPNRSSSSNFVSAPHLNLKSSRQRIEGDGYGGQGYTILPLLDDEPPATVILLHGLGGEGEEWGFVSLALSFFSLNYVKFIIPTAPVRNVTYLRDQLPSWYNIFRLGNSLASLRLNQTELLASVARIENIVRQEVLAGVLQRRIFIIGFSQGGAVALTAFLRSNYALAGCMGVATWLPLETSYPAQLSRRVQDKRIYLLHVSFSPSVRCLS